MLKIVPREAALIFSESGSNTLLISDLHLGLEKEMARKGFSVPSYSVKMVERIKDLADDFKVERVVILGDVKHSVGKVEDIDWSILPWFFETMLDLFARVEVVPGNHDGSIRTLVPNRVKLHPSEGAVLGEGRSRIGVAHGHAWPSEEAVATGNLVIGHSHFTYEMQDRFGSRSRESVWIFGRYRIEELLSKAGYSSAKRGRGELVVMPPFNRMVGGHPINRARSFQFGPVLSSGCVTLSEADVFLMDGTRVS
jgi:putative SbcD/Mre11-related phosphoesterase